MLRAKFAQQSLRSSARLLSTSRVLRNEASSSPGAIVPKKPIGGVRGGFVPFFYQLEDTNTFVRLA